VSVSGRRIRQATTFNLDEFAGISGDDPRSFRTFMRKHLFSHVNLPPDRAHVLDGGRKDWRSEIREFESAMTAAGGLDLVLLGIGRNGHIGFNEPGSAPNSGTRLVTLDDLTRRDAAREVRDAAHAGNAHSRGTRRDDFGNRGHADHVHAESLEHPDFGRRFVRRA